MKDGKNLIIFFMLILSTKSTTFQTQTRSLLRQTLMEMNFILILWINLNLMIIFYSKIKFP